MIKYLQKTSGGYLLILIVLFLFGCQSKLTNKEKLLNYLTNDSISMWDITMKRLAVLSDTSYYHNYFRSISFRKNFECDQYAKTIWGDRHMEVLGPEPGYADLCNKWEILNDSTVKLNCKNVFVVRIISKDTLHLIDVSGIKKHEMYRVQQPWNIDEETVKFIDKQVKSGEYLDKRTY